MHLTELVISISKLTTSSQVSFDQLFGESVSPNNGKHQTWRVVYKSRDVNENFKLQIYFVLYFYDIAAATRN